MIEEDKFVREEFIQNYLQYRWLDETRSKLIDRFFIILFAVFAARLQYAVFFEKTTSWLCGLWMFFIIVSWFMAKSIITFRRQQKGHYQVIKAIDEKLPFKKTKFKEFVKYRKGRRVHITMWIEILIAVIATFSPFLIFDLLDVSKMGCIAWGCVAIFIILYTTVSIIYIWIPFYNYNFQESFDWEKY